MLPRRCKKCACYIAPQLTKCPRCGLTAPALKEAATKEDRAASRLSADEKVPRVGRKKVRWAPSERAVESHAQTIDELKRQIERTDSVRLRNALRSQIRACKAIVEKGAKRKGAWTYEFFRTKHAAVPVAISPKGNRYVLAPTDAKADLIVQNRRGAAMPFSRLQRFEKSKYYRHVKDEQKAERVQKKRVVAKKQRRIQKRKAVQSTLE